MFISCLQLCKELPPRTVSYTWQLKYSTSRHGSSLKSLYRKLSGTDSPVLIVIKDALDEVKNKETTHLQYQSLQKTAKKMFPFPVKHFITLC